MAGDAVSTMAKPQLRGLLLKNIKRNLTGAIISSIAVMIGFKVFYNDVKKQKYADFYKDYDAMADFERMRDKGLFQSVPASK